MEIEIMSAIDAAKKAQKIKESKISKKEKETEELLNRYIGSISYNDAIKSLCEDIEQSIKNGHHSTVSYINLDSSGLYLSDSTYAKEGTCSKEYKSDEVKRAVADKAIQIIIKEFTVKGYKMEAEHYGSSGEYNRKNFRIVISWKKEDVESLKIENKLKSDLSNATRDFMDNMLQAYKNEYSNVKITKQMLKDAMIHGIDQYLELDFNN